MERSWAGVRRGLATLFVAWVCATLTSIAVSTFSSGTVGSIAGGCVALGYWNLRRWRRTVEAVRAAR